MTTTTLTHPGPTPSRLSCISLLVAVAAAGLAVVSLTVASDDDVGDVVVRTTPGRVPQSDASAVNQSDIEKALAELRSDEEALRSVYVTLAPPRVAVAPAEPQARARPDGCYERPDGAYAC